jgi:uncharacterized protein YkwD
LGKLMRFLIRSCVLSFLLLPACGGSSGAANTTPVVLDAEEARLREVETQLFALANETRESQGKPRLAYDDRLAAVARAHSRDMVEHAFFSHQSPRTGSPNERVVASGMRSSIVLENLAEAAGAVEIHRGWMDSPSHRTNLINGDVNHVGIGVVAVSRGGNVTYVATQLFSHQTPRLEASTAPALLLERVNSARRSRGARPLELDDNLSRVASEAAARFFAEPGVTEQTVLDDASASLRRFAIQFRRVGGVMTIVTSLDEAAQLEPVLDGEVRYVGIGVAQGTRADTSDNAILIVYLLGWAR